MHYEASFNFETSPEKRWEMKNVLRSVKLVWVGGKVIRRMKKGLKNWVGVSRSLNGGYLSSQPSLLASPRCAAALDKADRSAKARNANFISAPLPLSQTKIIVPVPLECF